MPEQILDFRFIMIPKVFTTIRDRMLFEWSRTWPERRAAAWQGNATAMHREQAALAAALFRDLSREAKSRIADAISAGTIDLDAETRQCAEHVFLPLRRTVEADLDTIASDYRAGGGLNPQMVEGVINVERANINREFDLLMDETAHALDIEITRKLAEARRFELDRAEADVRRRRETIKFYVELASKLFAFGSVAFAALSTASQQAAGWITSLILLAIAGFSLLISRFTTSSRSDTL